jgi:hypothetical protein
MSVKLRIKKLEAGSQTNHGLVVTRGMCEVSNELFERITGIKRPIDYSGVGKPLGKLSEESKRLIDKLVAREDLN